jgi:hypothetical protein
MSNQQSTNLNNMKIKFKIDIPTDIEKPTVDDMVFRTSDGDKELNFDDWWDNFIGNSDIIQKLKTNKWIYNDD